MRSDLLLGLPLMQMSLDDCPILFRYGLVSGEETMERGISVKAIILFSSKTKDLTPSPKELEPGYFHSVEKSTYQP